MSGQPAGGPGTGAPPAGMQRAVGRLTTGVTVLTVAHRGRVHAATVSSTSVVSWSPLLLGAGLRRGSLTCQLACDSGRFAVNVLAARQALVADWFANPARPAGAGQFEPVDWEPDPHTGIPLLRGVLAVLVCRVVDRLPVGDHDLVMGEVVTATAGDGSPLVSHGGALHGAEFHDVTRRRSWLSPAGTAVGVD